MLLIPMRRLKNNHSSLQKIIVAALLSLVLTSCGEMFDFDEENNEELATEMQLDLHDAYIMLGDSLQLTATFDSDDVTKQNLFWYVDDEECLHLNAYGTVLAQQMGDTYVHVISRSSLLEDSCLVHVIPRWRVGQYGQYPHDMVIYARNSIGGRPLSSTQMVAALVGDEVRGVAYVHENTNHPSSTVETFLILRVYAPLPDSAEEVTFWLYDRAQFTLRQSAVTMTFDGESHGSLTQLFDLGF